MLFLAKYWKLIAIGAVVAVLSLIIWIRTDQRDSARAQYKAEHDALILFAARTKAKAEEIGRRFAETRARVEGEQNRISQESQSAYETRIAELRARVERLRDNQDRANTSGSGRADVPRVSIAASGSDAIAADHGLSAEQRIVATEQAIQLDELIKWVQRQQGVTR